MSYMDSKTKLFSWLTHGTGPVQEGSVIERGADEASRSGVLHNFFAGTSGLSCFRSNGAETLPELQQQLGLVETAVPCFGSVPSSPPFAWASLAGRLSESLVCPAETARDVSSPGICIRNPVGLMQTDRACCDMLTSGAKPEKLEVYTSEICQKRFILFDHSGSKNRIICHPSMLDEISNLLPNCLNSPRNHLNHLQDLSSRAVVEVEETTAADFKEQQFPELSCKKGLHSDYGPCMTRIHSSLETISIKEGECLRQLDAAAVDTTIGSCYRGSSDDSNGLHEDTDLEALLSSDDEFSTGHSPSDETWNEAASLTSRDVWDSDQSVNSKKRKRQLFDLCNDDDMCSTFTSSEVGSKYLNSHSTETSHSGSDSFGLGAGYSEEELTAFDLCFPDEASSESSTIKHGLHGKRGSRSGQDCMPLPAQPESVKVSRKNKIKDVFRLLRGIIPGGGSMDAAFVLDETIQYVKSLQVQLQSTKTGM